MTVLALTFVIGLLNGLRSFTPPAAVAWAAHLRWIKLQGALALIGSVPAVSPKTDMHCPFDNPIAFLIICIP